MANNILECLLLELLSGNSESMYKTSEQVNAMLSNADTINELCNLLQKHANPGVRQYAAVLLRKCVATESSWEALSSEIQNKLRKDLVYSVYNETNKPVLKAKISLIGSIGRFGINSQSWPELLKFFDDACTNENPNIRELGMWVLSLVADYATDSLLPLMSSLMKLCNQRLKDNEPGILLYTIKAAACLSAAAKTSELKQFRQLIPSIFTVIKKLTDVNQEMALESLEVFDELFEYEVPILQPYVRQVFDFLLGIMNHKEFDDNLRARACTYISWIVKRKKKLIIKQKLLDILFDSVVNILNEVEEDDDNEEKILPSEAAIMFETPDPDDITTVNTAVHVLMISICDNFPSQKILPSILERVQTMLASEEAVKRRSAVICLALTIEGCSDFVRKHHLQSLLQVVSQSVNDSCQSVRNAALFTLGQMCQCLQPDISRHSHEILPFLLTFIKPELYNKEDLPSDFIRAHTKVFYAIEVFCENLTKQRFSAFLNPIMTTLLTVLQQPNLSSKIRQFTLSVISSVTVSSTKSMMPYTPPILEFLHKYFVMVTNENEEDIKSQSQAIETLSFIIRNVFAKGQAPQNVIEESANIALQIIVNAVDPDLKRTIYSLCAAISCCTKNATSTVWLEQSLKPMFDVIETQESTLKSMKNLRKETLGGSWLQSLEKNIELMEDEQSDDEDNTHAVSNVESSYFDEQEDACTYLAEIASNTGPLFAPYFERSFNSIKALVLSRNINIKKSALESLVKIVVAAFKITLDKKYILNVSTECVKNLIEIIRNCNNKNVVSVSLSSYADLIAEVGEVLLKETSIIETTFEIIRDVLGVKLPCQISNDADDDNDDDIDDEDEDDGLILESCGEIFPALAKHLDSDMFLIHFASMSSLFDKYLKSPNDDSERAFVIGCISEVIESVGKKVITDTNRNIPTNLQKLAFAAKDTFLKALSEEDSDVRNNAIYGIGILIQYGGFSSEMAKGFTHKLMTLIGTENEERCKDQIISAIARSTVILGEALPLENIVKTILSAMPLCEDIAENNNCILCLGTLYQNSSVLTAYTERLGVVLIRLLDDDVLKQDGKEVAIFLLNAIKKHNPVDIDQLLQNFPDVKQYIA